MSATASFCRAKHADGTSADFWILHSLGNIRSCSRIDRRRFPYHDNAVHHDGAVDWISDPCWLRACTRSSNGTVLSIYDVTKAVNNDYLKPVTAVQSFLQPSEVALATSQIFFFQFLGGAVFIALGETTFSSALRAALQSAILDVDIETIIAGGPTRVREYVSSPDLPGVLHAYNHAITTTYVRYPSLER